MKFERFEDIISWQKAKVLTVTIYKLFDTSKDFGFKDQIQRAFVSIMNNIAEGYERKSNKEFRRFFIYRQRLLRRSTLNVNPCQRIAQN